MNSVTKKTQITKAVREIVRQRDGDSCIFCRMYWEESGIMPISNSQDLQIAHYISRNRGGSGNEKNLAAVCWQHHLQLDQGDGLTRCIMKNDFRRYMESKYDDWKEEDLYIKSRWEE